MVSSGSGLVVSSDSEWFRVVLVSGSYGKLRVLRVLTGSYGLLREIT